MTDLQELDTLVSLSKNEGVLIVEFSHQLSAKGLHTYQAEFLGRKY